MDFNESRKAYNQIPIPSTLNWKVGEAIHMAKKSKTTSDRKAVPFKRHKWLYSVAGVAAVLVLAFVVSVNASTAFAATLSKVPIIGNLVTVVTGVNYTQNYNNNSNVNMDVNVPQINVDPTVTDKVTTVTAEQVNAQIKSAVDEYVAEQQKAVDEYKQAFLATGGTIDEWNARQIDIKADYEIKYQNNQYLSLYLYMSMSAFAYTQENKYYNYNFATGKELTLKDVLGDDYINIANKSIISQIEEQIASDPNKIYFGYNSGVPMDDAKFKTITDDTKFYLNADGKPVVCFAKYEIAPGYMGVCEFVIEK